MDAVAGKGNGKKSNQDVDHLLLAHVSPAGYDIVSFSIGILFLHSAMK
jgi:hypothetical protein